MEVSYKSSENSKLNEPKPNKVLYLETFKLTLKDQPRKISKHTTTSQKAIFHNMLQNLITISNKRDASTHLKKQIFPNMLIDLLNSVFTRNGDLYNSPILKFTLDINKRTCDTLSLDGICQKNPHPFPPSSASKEK